MNTEKERKPGAKRAKVKIRIEEIPEETSPLKEGTISLFEFLAGKTAARVNVDLEDPLTKELTQIYMEAHPGTTEMQAATLIYLEECKRRGW